MCGRRAAAEGEEQEKAEISRSIAGQVQARVEAAMQSPEIQSRIEQRLLEERSRLEQQVDCALAIFVARLSCGAFGMDAAAAMSILPGQLHHKEWQ